MAVYSWLKENDLSGKTVLLFCTSGGNQIDQTLPRLHKALPNSKIIDGPTINRPIGMEEWLEQLGYGKEKPVATAQKAGTELKLTIPVKLKINGKVFEANFYDYQPTQDLLKQMPLTVSLNRGSKDFCGGSLNISYKETDLVDRYEIGDLTYWIPGKNFVIFTNGDGKVAGKDLVPLGKLKAPVQEILQLGDGLEVVLEK